MKDDGLVAVLVSIVKTTKNLPKRIQMVGPANYDHDIQPEVDK